MGAEAEVARKLWGSMTGEDGMGKSVERQNRLDCCWALNLKRNASRRDACACLQMTNWSQVAADHHYRCRLPIIIRRQRAYKPCNRLLLALQLLRASLLILRFLMHSTPSKQLRSRRHFFLGCMVQHHHQFPPSRWTGKRKLRG